MNLNETILQKLAEWRPSAGRQTLNLPDEGDGWALGLTVDRHDELGSLVWELTVRLNTPRAGDQGLGAWARAVADRVTGLLEPLKVVEVDVQRQEALLRSDEPAHRGEQLFYYEAILRGTTEALVRRYKAVHQGNGKREQVAFALTNEALAKLVIDVTDIA
jgi:hypothetical protein